MIETIWTMDANLNDANQVVCKIEPKHGKYRVSVEYRKTDEQGNSWFRRFDYESTYSYKTAAAARGKAEKLKKIYSN